MVKSKKNIIGWESPIAIHPGEFLEEILEDYSITQVELSERIGLHKKVINEIINGKNPITHLTAFKLSKIFPMSFEYWINLQNSFEDDLARIEVKEKINKEISNFLPAFKLVYKELSDHNFLDGLRWVSGNFEHIILELQRFFAVDSLGYVQEPTLEVAFRKYNRKNLDNYNLAAWLRLGEIKAINTNTSTFSEKKLKENLNKIKDLSIENSKVYLSKVEKILLDCGVVLACIPYLKNTYIQGATKRISSDKYLIMLNTTKQDEGKFWFNLFHEIGHLLEHKKLESFVDINDDGIKSKLEKEADSFAQKMLIPDFKKVVEKIKSYSRLDIGIIEVSKKLNISTAILAGRITHELNGNKDIYCLMSKFLKSKIDYTNI